MKIIKGADRGRTEWTARKLVELVEDGIVNPNYSRHCAFNI